MSNGQPQLFKEVLNECASQGKYQETCQRIAGNKGYNQHILNPSYPPWVRLRTEPDRYLTDADLRKIFSPMKPITGLTGRCPTA
jgi:hypothetical protein